MTKLKFVDEILTNDNFLIKTQELVAIVVRMFNEELISHREAAEEISELLLRLEQLNQE